MKNYNKLLSSKLDNVESVSELIKSTWLDQTGILFYPYNINKVECVDRLEYVNGLVPTDNLFMADWYASEFDYVEAILEFCKLEINDCYEIDESYGGFENSRISEYMKKRDVYSNICNKLNTLLP